MNDNVISLANRRQQTQTQIEAEIEEPAAPVDAGEAHKEANLQMLRTARNLVENDQLEGLIVIGRMKGRPGIFHTNLAFDRAIIKREDAFAYIGALEILKLELSPMAQMAPELVADGSVLDAEVVSIEQAND